MTDEEKIGTYILKLFHLDKLCSECKGPIEIENGLKCNLCTLKKDLEVYLNIIETNCMSIRYTSGLGNRFATNRTKQVAKEAKQKPIQKKKQVTIKKKTTKKKAK